MIVHQSVRPSTFAQCIDRISGYNPAGIVKIHPPGHHGAGVCIETDNPQDTGFVRVLIAQKTRGLIVSRKRRLMALARARTLEYLSKER
jgi:hypothetical protein